METNINLKHLNLLENLKTEIPEKLFLFFLIFLFCSSCCSLDSNCRPLYYKRVSGRKNVDCFHCNFHLIFFFFPLWLASQLSSAAAILISKKIVKLAKFSMLCRVGERRKFNILYFLIVVYFLI